MRNSLRFLSVVLIVVLLPTLAGATHPGFPDTITTPNVGYNINFTNDNPPPATDLNFFSTTQAQNFANALDNTNAATAGNPNGYHAGYVNQGFQAPDFDGADLDVNVFDCGPHGGCDSGNAPADRIQMPAPGYLGSSEACGRLVLGHELFHHVQYAYIDFDNWVAWGGVPVEGTARMMQDKIYNDLDGNAGCITYDGEVDGFLGNPNQTIWNISYASALFWNYLSEQLGTVVGEPQRGVDFVRAFWENAEDNSGSIDTVNTMRQTITEFDSDATLEEMFHDFTIANYAKDLDVAALSDALKYRYIDENDATGQTYNAVARRWSGTIAPTRSASDSVVRWGSRYYEANISDQCRSRSVVGFLADGDPAAYSLLAIKGTDSVERLYKSRSGHFARAFFQRSSSPYTRLGAVVAGLDSDVNFTYTFDCGPAKVTIVRPTSTYKAYVGEHDAPDRFLIRLDVTGPTSLGEPSVEGLDPSDFQVFVGTEDPANQAPVVSGAYVQGQYWLVAQAPTKAAKGTFPLRVRLSDSFTATQENAVIYEKMILDQMLVIDRSGSMLSPASSPKLDAAKNAARLFVDSARSDDQLGVVSFGGDNVEPNDDATTLRNLQPVSDGSRAAANTAINGIATAPTVLTSIGDGMRKAALQFPAFGTALGEDWIVLMSDGMENEALFWNDPLVRTAIIDAGIKVHAIALGPLTDQALLQDIAASTGGDYYYVDVGTGGASMNAIDGAAAMPAAITTIANRLGDAYASALERMERHERIWEHSGTVASGATLEQTIAIDEGGISDALFTFNWSDPATRLGVEIERPDGSIVSDGVAGAEVFEADTHYTARIGTMERGTWTVRLRGATGSPTYIAKLSGKNQQGAQLSMYLGQYQGDPSLLAQRGRFMRGLPMPILASLTDRRGGVQGAEVVAVVEHPDGRVIRLPLLDDGSHGDGAADDGIYGNFYTPTTAASTRRGPPEDPNPERGSYNVHLEAEGKDNFGEPFSRIRKGSFQVFEGFSREQKDPDPDRDDMPTRYEELHSCLDPAVADADKDPDEDGVSNGEEWKLGTNPCDPDTDGGGESDRSELGRNANVFDPRDDALPKPVDVEVVDWVLDHLPRPDIRPNSNLIRYPVNPAYARIRLLRSTNADGPFVEVTQFDAAANRGVYRDDGLTNGTTYYYRVQGVDLNGNLSAPSHIFRGRPQADSIPPIGHVVINVHRPFVIGRLVRLQLFIDPETAGGSGVHDHTDGADHAHSAPAQVEEGSEMLISNDPTFSDAKWQPYQPEVDWTLDPNADGAANVFVKFRDKAGNESTVYHESTTVRRSGTLGSIRGKAFIRNLANLSGVQVFVLNDSNVPPAMSEADGSFVLPDLAPGTYRLKLVRDGSGVAYVDAVVEPGADTDIGTIPLGMQQVYLPLVRR